MIIIKKKISIKSSATLIISIFLFVLQIINFSSEVRKIDLSSDFFDDIRKIQWEDTANLEQMGFYDYDEYYTIFAEDKESMYSVVVRKVSEVPDDLKTNGNISYNIYETGPGIFSLKRLINSENPIIRDYKIYINGVEITVKEDNVEHSKPLFPELLKSLVQKQKMIE